jgi:hypothetical protein
MPMTHTPLSYLIVYALCYSSRVGLGLCTEFEQQVDSLETTVPPVLGILLYSEA